MTTPTCQLIWTVFNAEAFDGLDRPRYTFLNTEDEAKRYAASVGLTSNEVELREWSDFNIANSNVDDQRNVLHPEVVTKFSVVVQNTKNHGVEIFHVFANHIDEAIGNAIEQSIDEWDCEADQPLALIVLDGHVTVLRTEI